MNFPQFLSLSFSILLKQPIHSLTFSSMSAIFQKLIGKLKLWPNFFSSFHSNWTVFDAEKKTFFFFVHPKNFPIHQFLSKFESR